MPGPRFELVTTLSGVLALHDSEAGEVMHPGLGPSAEADVLHVEGAGLLERLTRAEDRPLIIFDIGLGAGSNAAAALRAVARARASATTVRPLELLSFERDLGSFAFALDHADVFALPETSRDLLERGVSEGEGYRWRLILGDVLSTLGHLASTDTRSDIIFWDPYSQAANPQLWTVEAFQRAHASASNDCVLTTYSNSTTVRSALLLAGWWIGRGPLLGGRRETTVASFGEMRDSFGAEFLERRERSSAPWPAGAPTDALDALRRHPQFAPARARIASTGHSHARTRGET